MELETPVVEPVVDTPPPEIPEESASLADHEASFGPEHKRQEPERHRAQSQKASADDVPQINALTKELRTKEAELAKVKPDALSGSPRVIALRRQIRAIEADLADLQKPAPKVESPKVEAPKPAARTIPTTFDKPEPKLDDFANEADPYAAHLRALTKWDREKEAFEAATQAAANETAQAQAEAEAIRREQASAYLEKKQTFAQSHPDFDAKIKALDDRKQVTPVLEQVILSADNGPELVYYLATNPDFYDELFMLTADRPVTDYFVAITQRRLTQRVQAASTGSAAPPKLVSTPRPPNPVRTGPIHTGDEPPGDDGSLADHERAYGPKRRR